MSFISACAHRVIETLYPPLCMSCGAETFAANGLCPACWPEAEFVHGLACTTCGTPLIGEGEGYCEECFADRPPWNDGVAVAVYGATTARMVQAMKHGDRLELVPKIGRWMADATKDIATSKAVVVPIPVHWRRLLSRRYNLAALLGEEVARHLNLEFAPRALHRVQSVTQQKSMTRDARFENQKGSMVVAEGADLKGRHVILVDDVMTSGATLRSATEVLQAHGVKAISISVFARVAPNL
ncbi:MAG: ComF family protein [Pseudomonadota bacterium]